MNMQLLAFILYFVAILGIGLFFFFKSKGSGEKDYFLGGRSMGPWVTALSAQASDMSGWLLMGFPGSILAAGMGQVWIGIGLALGTAANWIFVARRLRKFSQAANDSITVPQYLSNRFLSKSHSVSIICAFSHKEPCASDNQRNCFSCFLHSLRCIKLRCRHEGFRYGYPCTCKT